MRLQIRRAVPEDAERLSAIARAATALLANTPSVAFATGLGYQPYATHLAVRLSPGGMPA
jgi:hypothetical protein